MSNTLRSKEQSDTSAGLPLSPAITRRAFGQLLGTGILISIVNGDAMAQRRGGGGGSRSMKISARLHVGKDGIITVMTGKVEVGQGSRAQITQAAAEELCVAPEVVRLVMADTDLVPDDGITAGSRTTPSTIPAVRQGTAAARELLVSLACDRWQVGTDGVSVENGTIRHAASGRAMTYTELANLGDLDRAFEQTIPESVRLRAVDEWKVLGTSMPRPNLGDLVTGAHRFPSDITRPGMLYGKVLRAPSYGAELVDIDLSAAQALEGVVVVRDGSFVGCAAPTSHLASKALAALEAAAKWETKPHPSSSELFDHLRRTARRRDGQQGTPDSNVKMLKAEYNIAYIQHVPMEPRAAVAEWTDGKLTVWTGSQAPTRVKGDLTGAFNLSDDKARVIIPDTGGGFGGKHSGECAVEAARLARAAGRPVSLRWTRAEEFTWAYFRPAGAIDIEAGLGADGRLAVWRYTTINPGSSGAACPYRSPISQVNSISCDEPLRQGSYRALGSTANNFARESFIDELALAAGTDPLVFRRDHIEEARLRDVLEAAALHFGWEERKRSKPADTGIGLACGTEKGSFVAACVEVKVDRTQGTYQIVRICETFECGAIQNPENLRRQVFGCIIMGLGGALTEEMRFENGEILNATFRDYQVPRFKSVPPIEVHLVNRPDLDSVGAGETPIMAVAPAIANAICDATGLRIRAMPIRNEEMRPA